MPNEARQEDKEADKEARANKVVRNVRLSLAILFGIPLVILLITGLYSFVGPTTPSEKKDFVQAVGVLVAGFAGVVGLFFTWRNLRLTRENTDRQLQVAREGQERTQEATRETLRITEQGQITERFTRAIDQLGESDAKTGEPKLEIRLGGIYALERIANDSPERDYSTVMAVLTAYVRENAPYSPVDEQEESGEQAEAAESQDHSAAIRAIVDVIRRLHGKDGVPEKYLAQLDLPNTNLQGSLFQGANLFGANLFGANLQKAILEEANLQGVILEGAILREAILQKATFFGAYPQGAVLQRASLEEADFQGANLRGAFLEGAHLTQEQVDLAVGDENTKLPEGLERPKAWSRRSR
jgi:hypothetical protein